MRFVFRGIKDMDLKGRGTRKGVEVRVVGDEKINTLYFPVHKYAITITHYALANTWNDLDACTPIVKLHYCHNVPAFASTCELLFLFGSALMGNRDMPSETQVYVVHHLTKNLTMSARVLNAVEMNVIVYHLMDDSVLHFSFRQIKADADTETEVVEFHLTKQFPLFLIHKHAKKGLGIA